MMAPITAISCFNGTVKGNSLVTLGLHSSQVVKRQQCCTVCLHVLLDWLLSYSLPHQQLFLKGRQNVEGSLADSAHAIALSLDFLASYSTILHCMLYLEGQINNFRKWLIDRQTDGRMEMDGWMDARMDEQTDKIDRETDGWMDR